uniref:Uncharacterized protein n=1 Tax=Steinernema glaseri TaxID=37863 RepID=A0A1I7YQN1_9BILA
MQRMTRDSPTGNASEIFQPPVGDASLAGSCQQNRPATYGQPRKNIRRPSGTMEPSASVAHLHIVFIFHLQPHR